MVKTTKTEMGRSVKYAYRLSDKVLAPQPIERTNVKLSDSLFDDSTINGLEHCSWGEEWQETANFLKLIRRWWNCVNVQSKFAATHKRDDRRLHISAEEKTQLQFLQAFYEWLAEWQAMLNSKKTGLSRETFLAAMQTTSALKELAEYLLEGTCLEYVLLGKINSDPIERRFGWYRQLAGTNYFISVRQFLEAEKKIRLQCLTKFGKLTLSEVAEVFHDTTAAEKEKIELTARGILALLSSESLSSNVKLNGEEGIIFYIAGYISRSVLKKTSCDTCSDLLVKSMDAPEIDVASDDEDSQEKTEFLRAVDRGGLVTSSELVYVICVHALQLKEELFDGAEIQEMFLATDSPRSAFVSILGRKIYGTPEAEELFNQKCDNGHTFLSFVLTTRPKFFNCMSKNFVSTLNDRIHASRKRAQKESKESAPGRKLKKLQSS
jgi:hypothetical protein